MPENVAYIWPNRSRLYCDTRPLLPTPHNDNIQLPHRDIVSLHNAGLRIKDIAATVPNPPKARTLTRADIAKDKDRPPEASLSGRFSARDQEYRERLGVFSPAIRQKDSKMATAVIDVLRYKSVAQLFHVSIKTRTALYNANCSHKGNRRQY
jgi:hypothetical protein